MSPEMSAIAGVVREKKKKKRKKTMGVHEVREEEKKNRGKNQV